MCDLFRLQWPRIYGIFILTICAQGSLKSDTHYVFDKYDWVQCAEHFRDTSAADTALIPDMWTTSRVINS